MKKITSLVLLVIAIAVGVTGCKKIIQSIFPGLEVDVPEIVVTVPYIPVPPGTPVPASELSLVSFTQHFNMDSLVKAKTNGEFGAGDISSVKLKQMIFTIANPDPQNNFSNFESARFTFSSNSNSSAQDIASFTFPDTYTPAVTYTAPENTPELISYLKGSELTYHVFGKIRRYTTKELIIRVQVTMRFK